MMRYNQSSLQWAMGSFPAQYKICNDEVFQIKMWVLHGRGGSSLIANFILKDF